MKLVFPLSGLLLSLVLFSACNVTGPSGFFGKRSPHEQYGQSLTNAGLNKTALGKMWFGQAERSLNNPLQVSVPYKETGYFPADQPRASALRFEAKRGELITISLTKKPQRNFTIYVDLWEDRESRDKKLLAYADTTGNPFKHEIDDSGTYILRLQPELLASGEYTLTITSGPSLAFPVKSGKIGSFWGADRDGGARRHEGIDIFAPRRTPAIAAADGVVNRVTINKLGGKVVFLRPQGKNYSLYYAHLDEQLVEAGQRVRQGDTVGLVGNTGNAISTSPHLHFGIYTFGGAIDPLPFVNPSRKTPVDITAPQPNIGRSVRTRTGSTTIRRAPAASADAVSSLKSNTLLQVQAAAAGWYKVILPDGKEGFVTSSSVSSATAPLRQLRLAEEKPLLAHADLVAPRKTTLPAGETVEVIGSFDNFLFIRKGNENGWISAE
ncbi:M23 family metallopeptidase [Pedobacter sp. SYSU D00535]|uniref:M23 family metallopeptidase n=1 Tax=Pedobacter sp. SYSU D00535 TaxID=2810308 RepID=UPI001A95888A|nr:M23 family metallopeptidase [Pedobacter sp. SYSU D00535]